MKRKKIFFYAAVIIALAAGTHFWQRYQDRMEQVRQERLLLEERKAAWQELTVQLQDEISRFKGTAGIVVKDMRTGWEFAHEKDREFPSASVAKVPLMAACFLAAEQGQIALDQEIALKNSHKMTGSGMLKNMPAGTTFSVQRLINLMIYDSDNTATNILTELLGREDLNRTFAAFGLTRTRLDRRIADYQARDKGIENFTTAGEKAMLLEKMYYRTLGSPYVSEQSLLTLKLTRMNDRIPKHLPVGTAVSHKTGLERGVCHDAGIVFTPKGDFIIAVLTRHSNPNSVPSKQFIARVALAVYEYFDK